MARRVSPTARTSQVGTTYASRGHLAGQAYEPTATSRHPYVICTLSVAVDRATAERGTLFLVSAGNPGPNTIGTTASAKDALTVGALNRDGTSIASLHVAGAATLLKQAALPGEPHVPRLYLWVSP